MRGLSDSAFKREVRFLRWMGKLRNKGKAILVFVQYLTRAMQQPSLFFNKVEGARPTSMNNLQYMKIVLMSKLHKTNEQGMDTPFGEVVFHLAALGEGEGTCGFVSDYNRDAGDIARKNYERRQTKNGERD